MTLIAAVQNKAVDVLVRMFRPFVTNSPSTSDVQMLVLGSAENPNLGVDAREFTVDALLAHNSRFQAAEQACNDARNPETIALAMRALAMIKQELTQKLFAGAKMIFSTITEIHKILTHPIISGAFLGQIRTVIVDEAGTVPEWQMVMLTGLPALERIVCIGDVNQLPPFTMVNGAHSALKAGQVVPYGFMERAQVSGAGSMHAKILV